MTTHGRSWNQRLAMCPVCALPGRSSGNGPPATCAGHVSAVVDELQGQAEVFALHQGDDRLQVILLLGRDAQLVALCLGPDSLRPLIPDELGDLPGVVGGDAFLEADPEPVLLAGEPRVAGIEGLERDPALDQLLLEHVEHRLGPLLAVGADVDGTVPGPGDGCAHAAEVEAGADLLGRLVEGVVDFLPIDAADDVERRLGGHRCSFSGPGTHRRSRGYCAPARGPARAPRCGLLAADVTRVNRSRRWGVRLKGASPARPTPGAVSQGRAVFAFPEPPAAAIPAPGRPPRPARPLDRGTGRYRPPSRQERAEAPTPVAAASSWPGGARVLAVTCTFRTQPAGPLSFTVPSCGAARGRLPERPKGAVCKTVGFVFPGSNPGPATS